MHLKTYRTDWPKYIKMTNNWSIKHKLNNEAKIDRCILELQKFLLNTHRKSSVSKNCNNNFLNTDPDNEIYLIELIKLGNYYRRRYQKTGFYRAKILRNILTNCIKNKLIDIRNNNWAEKLKIIHTKNNSGILLNLYKEKRH